MPNSQVAWALCPAGDSRLPSNANNVLMHPPWTYYWSELCSETCHRCLDTCGNKGDEVETHISVYVNADIPQIWRTDIVCGSDDTVWQSSLERFIGLLEKILVCGLCMVLVKTAHEHHPHASHARINTDTYRHRYNMNRHLFEFGEILSWVLFFGAVGWDGNGVRRCVCASRVWRAVSELRWGGHPEWIPQVWGSFIDNR